jgi:squalene synthase HpnC
MTDRRTEVTQHNRPIAEPSNRIARNDLVDMPDDVSERLERAEGQTRRLARSHYENFLVASILLPRRLRQPFYNIYAFCRTADDLADESESPDAALRHLDDYQEKLDAVFDGAAPDGLFLALANTINQFDLTKQPFDDLLDAFRQDQRKTRYSTFDEVHDYCRRSANPVGRIVLGLVGTSDDRTRELSDEICTGLQLANFWQDVSRDHRKGRIYLPADEMRRFGVDETMFQQSDTPQPLRQLLASECNRAEAFLERGLGLAQHVPPWFASDVRLFAHGGLATLRAIRRIEFDVLRVRPTVGRSTQLWMLLRAAMGRL